MNAAFNDDDKLIRMVNAMLAKRTPQKYVDSAKALIAYVEGKYISPPAAKKTPTRKIVTKRATITKGQMLKPSKHWFTPEDLTDNGFEPTSYVVGKRGKFCTSKPLEMRDGSKIRPGDWCKIVAPSLITGKNKTYTVQYLYGGSERGAKGYPRGLTFAMANGKEYIWFDAISGGEDIVSWVKIAPPKAR